MNVEFFDVAGRRVRSLSREDVLGEQSFVFDGRDDDGRALPNGIYFCRVKAAGETHTLKVGVLR